MAKDFIPRDMMEELMKKVMNIIHDADVKVAKLCEKTEGLYAPLILLHAHARAIDTFATMVGIELKAVSDGKTSDEVYDSFQKYKKDIENKDSDYVG
ncbi:hypothetical protein HQ529_03475 [Candidatus Woesearchaeota archaeon]|nr:hypothetical protein [Candidatus Woesearchaeota archaeon]